MSFTPFEVTTPHIIYACLGGFIVLFGMLSLFLREKLYVGEACWAFLFGVVIGPYAANIFDPHSLGGHSEDTTNIITLEITRVVLAIGVFAIGVELPKAYMKKHWKSLAFLLVPVMTYGWFVCAGFIYLLVPGLDFLSSLAVAACLTPTDPILAAAVVGGKWADKHVPAHIRHLLAAESGCNDGAAFPFLYIALYLIMDQSTGHALKDWFLILWLYQVILGSIIGAIIGFSFRHLMKFCERHNLIDRHSYVAQYISLAMLTIGLTTLLGSDDLLAAFTCGTAFAWDGFFNRQTEESVFSSVIDLLFNIAAFIYVGAWMPFGSFNDKELGGLTVWRLVVLAICVIGLRRLPIVCALYRWIPDVKTWREAVFVGHFGPIGVGGVFISTLATEVLLKSHRSELPGGEQALLVMQTIQPITAFMVLCSILIHGLSIPSFSLGRRVHSVSRTWSRHTTLQTNGGAEGAGLPEWAGQARHVRRGDDIVINRDPDPEMGIVQEGSDTAVNYQDEKVHDNDKEEEKETEEHGDGDVPPDGTEILAEWQEGNTRVVERRAGPGEEVEVEAIRNADTPHQSVSTSFETEHPHISAVMSQMRAGSLHHPALHSQIEEHVRRNEEAVQATSANNGDSDDEGWASENSASGGIERDARPRSRSPKKLSPRIRNKFIKNAGIAPHVQIRDFGAMHRRVDALKEGESVRSSRESSPARGPNVRFADGTSGSGRESGNVTPRAFPPDSPNASGRATPTGQ